MREKCETITIKVETHLKKQIEELAHNQGISISEYVRRILESSKPAEIVAPNTPPEKIFDDF